MVFKLIGPYGTKSHASGGAEGAASVIAKPLALIFERSEHSRELPGKSHTQLQIGQEGESGELQAGEHHLTSWEDYGANPPGSCFQVRGR